MSHGFVELSIFTVNWILWSTNWSGSCRGNALQPLLSW